LAKIKRPKIREILLFLRVDLLCWSLPGIEKSTFKPYSVEPIPFLSFRRQHEQIQAAVEVAIAGVYNRDFFILGPEVRAFEQVYAQTHGSRHCIGVGNGLDALTLALLAAGIGPGDDVIIPAHTYIASWLAVSRVGARLIPVEPDPATYNIDVTRIEAAITPQTRAILPVHLYGQACNMTAINDLAGKHNLTVIEDNAQAHGARWGQQKTGSFGAINATSFYPTKNLGALGDGGAVTTDSDTMDAFVRRHRNYGFEQKDISVERGLNSRLDELQAAVLTVKLRYLDAWNECRRSLAIQYLEMLQGVGDLILPLSDKEAYHVYHLFVIRTAHRDKLKAFLADRGVGTLVHYPIPPHLQQSYQSLNYTRGDFPLTEQMADTVLSLPLWPGLETTQVARVCDAIRAFF